MFREQKDSCMLQKKAVYMLIVNYKMQIPQLLTVNVVVQGDANPLRGARDTAVHLIHLNWGLGLLLLSLTILPDILIWCNKNKINTSM